MPHIPVYRAAKCLNCAPKTLYRYLRAGAPSKKEGRRTVVDPEEIKQWMLLHGYTGERGRSPYRAVPVESVKTPSAPSAPEVKGPKLPPDPTVTDPRPSRKILEVTEEDIYAQVRESPNPLQHATLVQRVEAAAYKRAQRLILEGEWVSREEVERVQTEQAAALRERLLAFADRLPPRLAGLEREAMRTVLEREVRAVLTEWSEGGEI